MVSHTGSKLPRHKWEIEILLRCFSIVNSKGEINQLRMKDKNIAIIKIYTQRRENNNWRKSKLLHIILSAWAKSVKLGLHSVLLKQIANLYAILSLEAEFVSLHQQQKAKHRQTFNIV